MDMRECRLARQPPDHLPATQTAQHRVAVKPNDQTTDGGNVPHHPGDEGTGKPNATFQGTARAPGLAKKPRKRDLVEDLHQTPVVLTQRADLFLDSGEERPLQSASSDRTSSRTRTSESPPRVECCRQHHYTSGHPPNQDNPPKTRRSPEKNTSSGGFCKSLISVRVTMSLGQMVRQGDGASKRSV